MLEVGESVTLVTLSPEDTTLAADIILLVDESSSMVMEHDWIPGMIRELDTALQVSNLIYLLHIGIIYVICVSPINRYM